MALAVVLHLDVLVATRDATTAIDRRPCEVNPEARRHREAEVLLDEVRVLTYLFHSCLPWQDLGAHGPRSRYMLSLNVKLPADASDDIGGQISERLVSQI